MSQTHLQEQLLLPLSQEAQRLLKDFITNSAEAKPLIEQMLYEVLQESTSLKELLTLAQDNSLSLSCFDQELQHEQKLLLVEFLTNKLFVQKPSSLAFLLPELCEYDSLISSHIKEIHRLLKRLFVGLKHLSQEECTYAHFSQDYIFIEIEIRSLLFAQKCRENDSFTYSFVELLQTLFEEHRQLHQQENLLNKTLILLHEQQFQRLFTVLNTMEALQPQNTPNYLKHENTTSLHKRAY